MVVVEHRVERAHEVRPQHGLVASDRRRHHPCTQPPKPSRQRPTTTRARRRLSVVPWRAQGRVEVAGGLPVEREHLTFAVAHQQLQSRKAARIAFAAGDQAPDHLDRGGQAHNIGVEQRAQPRWGVVRQQRPQKRHDSHGYQRVRGSRVDNCEAPAFAWDWQQPLGNSDEHWRMDQVERFVQHLRRIAGPPFMMWLSMHAS
jgi:hypothetical protein